MAFCFEDTRKTLKSNAVLVVILFLESNGIAMRIKFNHNVHVQSSGLPQAGIKAQNLKFELAKRFPLKCKNSSSIRDFMAIFTERVLQRES